LSDQLVLHALTCKLSSYFISLYGMYLLFTCYIGVILDLKQPLSNAVVLHFIVYQ